MKTRLPFAGLLCALAFLAAMPSARAQQAVFNTLGAGSTYDPSGGQFVTGTTYQGIANAFAPSASGDLLMIELGISRADDGANGQFILELRLPDAMNRPGAIIASGELTTVNTIGFSNTALTTFNYSGPSVALVSGQTYWLTLQPQNAATNVIWNFGAGQTGSITSTNNGTTYGAPFTGTLSAFRVSIVPEPATYAFCLAGAGLFLGARRLRRPR